jgi:hypothetical protein
MQHPYKSQQEIEDSRTGKDLGTKVNASIGTPYREDRRTSVGREGISAATGPKDTRNLSHRTKELLFLLMAIVIGTLAAMGTLGFLALIEIGQWGVWPGCW